MSSYAWLDEARCGNSLRIEGRDLFFGSAPDQERAKRKYCATCPVTWECLRSAIHFGSWDGVFGGMTAQDRSTFYTKYHVSGSPPGPRAESAHRKIMQGIRTTT